ncbi:MAG: hypothetical protein AVDCRST_MAG57-2976, partial [uncultured Blastococcus sp.]
AVADRGDRRPRPRRPGRRRLRGARCGRPVAPGGRRRRARGPPAAGRGAGHRRTGRRAGRQVCRPPL